MSGLKPEEISIALSAEVLDPTKREEIVRFLAKLKCGEDINIDGRQYDWHFGGSSPEQHRCPDCGVAIGGIHNPRCDVERCPCTGRQRLTCCCGCSRPRLRWTGKWPGEAECEEFGWGHPSIPDLSRLRHPFVKWDADAGRWRKIEGAPPAGPCLGGLWRVVDKRRGESFFDLSRLVATLPSEQRSEIEASLASLENVDPLTLSTVKKVFKIDTRALREFQARDWQPLSK